MKRVVATVTLATMNEMLQALCWTYFERRDNLSTGDEFSIWWSMCRFRTSVDLANNARTYQESCE